MAQYHTQYSHGEGNLWDVLVRIKVYFETKMTEWHHFILDIHPFVIIDFAY